MGKPLSEPAFTTAATQALPAEQLERLQHFAELGRLSASLLHELSNPLTAAILHLGQYGEKHLSGVRQAQHSLHMMRRYVEAARQQVRQQSLTASFSVQPSIDQLKRLIVPMARSRGVQLDMEASPRCRLRGDPVKFQHILSNLITNAIDAYRHDTFASLARPVRVQIRASKKLLTIRVIDWGEGIAAEQLPHLFEPFYTTKSHQTGHGLGIGLAIVQQYVSQDFQGSVTVTSSRRQGTQFTIRLPLESFNTGL